MNKSRCLISIYINLSKAFDRLDHNILLSKLKFYGLDDKAINLLRNYLSNMDQFVQLGNIKSNHHLMSYLTWYTTVQGSVIGPLLFNIVINDLTSATQNLITSCMPMTLH